MALITVGATPRNTRSLFVGGRRSSVQHRVRRHPKTTGVRRAPPQSMEGKAGAAGSQPDRAVANWIRRSCCRVGPRQTGRSRRKMCPGQRKTPSSGQTSWAGCPIAPRARLPIAHCPLARPPENPAFQGYIGGKATVEGNQTKSVHAAHSGPDLQTGGNPLLKSGAETRPISAETADARTAI